VKTKVKTAGTEKNTVEEAVQTPTWRGCANSIISQSRVHAWSPTPVLSKMPGIILGFGFLDEHYVLDRKFLPKSLMC
jgi:hypothetical protein